MDVINIHLNQLPVQIKINSLVRLHLPDSYIQNLSWFPKIPAKNLRILFRKGQFTHWLWSINQKYHQLKSELLLSLNHLPFFLHWTIWYHLVRMQCELLPLAGPQIQTQPPPVVHSTVQLQTTNDGVYQHLNPKFYKNKILFNEYIARS